MDHVKFAEHVRWDGQTILTAQVWLEVKCIKDERAIGAQHEELRRAFGMMFYRQLLDDVRERENTCKCDQLIDRYARAELGYLAAPAQPEGGQ